MDLYGFGSKIVKVTFSRIDSVDYVCTWRDNKINIHLYIFYKILKCLNPAMF